MTIMEIQPYTNIYQYLKTKQISQTHQELKVRTSQALEGIPRTFKDYDVKVSQNAFLNCLLIILRQVPTLSFEDLSNLKLLCQTAYQTVVHVTSATPLYQQVTSHPVYQNLTSVFMGELASNYKLLAQPISKQNILHPFFVHSTVAYLLDREIPALNHIDYKLMMEAHDHTNKKFLESDLVKQDILSPHDWNKMNFLQAFVIMGGRNNQDVSQEKTIWGDSIMPGHLLACHEIINEENGFVNKFRQGRVHASAYTIDDLVIFTPSQLRVLGHPIFYGILTGMDFRKIFMFYANINSGSIFKNNELNGTDYNNPRYLARYNAYLADSFPDFRVSIDTLTQLSRISTDGLVFFMLFFPLYYQKCYKGEEFNTRELFNEFLSLYTRYMDGQITITQFFQPAKAIHYSHIDLQGIKYATQPTQYENHIKFVAEEILLREEEIQNNHNNLTLGHNFFHVHEWHYLG